MLKIQNGKIMDLHNHTVWSDGSDSAKDIIQNAIKHKIEYVAITDHFGKDGKHTVGVNNLDQYINKITSLKEEFNEKINTLIGVEITYKFLFANKDELPYDKLNTLDFILIENLDYIPETTNLNDVRALFERFSCAKGLAHTDLMKLAVKFGSRGGLDYIIDFMKKSELFWEINTDSTYDIFYHIINQSSIDFETLKILRRLKEEEIPVTVGSDTHSLTQYDIGRLRVANERWWSLKAVVEASMGG